VIQHREKPASLTILLPNRHGAQNVGDGASKAQLENEFGTNNDDEVIAKILEQGEIQTTEVWWQHQKLSLFMSIGDLLMRAY
jgi:Shwachman-Bodian-Diamond syndrome (SBDS) protein